MNYESDSASSGKQVKYAINIQISEIKKNSQMNYPEKNTSNFNNNFFNLQL